MRKVRARTTRSKTLQEAMVGLLASMTATQPCEWEQTYGPSPNASGQRWFRHRSGVQAFGVDSRSKGPIAVVHGQDESVCGPDASKTPMMIAVMRPEFGAIATST